MSTTKNKKTVCASDSNPSANGINIVMLQCQFGIFATQNQHLIALPGASASNHPVARRDS
jgi:hypothetical protein